MNRYRAELAEAKFQILCNSVCLAKLPLSRSQMGDNCMCMQCFLETKRCWYNGVFTRGDRSRRSVARPIAAISRATDRGDDRRDDRVYVYTVRSAAIASCKRRVMLALRHHALTWFLPDFPAAWKRRRYAVLARTVINPLRACKYILTTET